MFEYLTGKLVFVGPAYIVLEVQGIGYRLLVANPYRYEQEADIKIYVEQIVRDNDQMLYGFYDLAEKQLFQQLTSVSGIGPKSALAILADNDHSGLIAAIINDDVKFLTKFPGVGKKTAQQIVLDLKDKITLQQDVSATPDSLFQQVTVETENTALQDGLAALAALGYSEREIQKIQPQLKQVDASDAGEYLRAGLKLLQ
ncbi:Holliday junction branch migration protein RuvA [Bombilactobacillus thymidiniphilus]|uniref:Holliday junction branch migration complex subunit RuvA n=1 Tax=Bombilactobacillus thymidiniphilus TaxID=2923363 RepID=A0ABY4PF23_9LACO|nr:Holliday junction branch migration protein RuvA [Bombilactobacillus thymidiniphilus]UQS83907.1 Holliday junction branch migration protein RuvA [Bombilactobacillus thymidiniphilus]